MSWDTLPKDNLEYLLSKLKTDVLDYKVDTEAGKGLSSNDFTTTEKNKLAGISSEATKVEASQTNGNIQIDGVETQVYDDSAKADKTGSYPELTAGKLFENNDLLPDVNDVQPYLYRVTDMPDGSVPYVQEKLIGASAAVNQFVQNGNFESTNGWSTFGQSTASVSNNTMNLTLSDGTYARANIGIQRTASNIPTDHKILFYADIRSSIGLPICAREVNSVVIAKTISANTWTRFEGIAPKTQETTRIDIFNDTIFTGAITLNLKNVNCIDLTQMFGTSIADTAYTKEQTSAGSGIAWLKSYGFFTKDYYPYNAGALQSVKTGSKKVVGKNLVEVTSASTTTNGIKFYVNEDKSITVSGTNQIAGWTGFTVGITKIYKNITYIANSSSNVTLSATTVKFRFDYYDKDMTFIGGFDVLNDDIIVQSIPENAEYAKSIIYVYSSYAIPSPIIIKPMLRISGSSADYEPYTSTTYPLDSDLELRGLYKLDASNNIVCDGDEYTPDGSVKRRYGIVDLGDINWAYESSYGFFRGPFGDSQYNAKKPSNTGTYPNYICAKYGLTGTVGSRSDMTSKPDKTLTAHVPSDAYNLAIKDSAYTDPTAFKTAMSGVYLIYELATSTTDTAASYQNPQIIHENGTEEFIDTRDYPLPVGHNTSYFTASDEKFFLPPVVDNDGRFLYHDGDGFQFKNFNRVASKVEESDINGNIKIDGVETQVYDDSELQGIVDTDTTVATGNPLNFSTKSAQNAVNTDIVIDPVQDLHGFTKPWVGGAGKNICVSILDDIKNAQYQSGTWSGNNYTIYGITLSIMTDSNNNVTGIKVGTGTATENILFYMSLNYFSVAAGTYIISGCPTGGSNTTYRFDARSQQGVLVENYGGDTLLSLPSGDSIMGVIRIQKNTQITSDLYFYPMFRKSTDPAGYEPYTNICPISPKEQIAVQGCGVNIWDEQWELGSYSVSDGTPISIGNAIRSKSTNYIAVGASKQYYVKYPGAYNLNVCFYDESKNYISNFVIGGSGVITTPERTKYLRFNVSSTYGTTYNNDISINSDYTDTSYHAYDESNNLQIPLPNDFYGGTLNLETGELVVDRGMVDLNDYTFEVFAGTTIVKTSSIPNVKYVPNNTVLGNGLSENYQMHTGSGMTSAIGCIAIDTNVVSVNAGIYPYQPTGKFVYEFATPYTLHLTPQQLNLLKATNNISTDAKTISVTYRNGELSTYAPATDIADGLLTATDKRAIDRTSDIVEGNPIQFSTESKQIARSTIIDLEPIQDLHGYSKPWVGGAGKNLLPLVLADIKSANTSGTWSGNAYTLNNVVFTVLIDSDNNVIGIHANGTANATTVFRLMDTQTSPFTSNMIFNGCPSGGSVTSYYMYFYDQTSDASRFIDSGSGANVDYSTISGHVIRILICINSGTQVTNKLFYPMLRLSTVSDATFEPYTNVASISGRSEVDILGCGKNLLDPTYNKVQIQGSFSDAGITYTYFGDGKIQLSNTATARSYGNFTFVTGSGTGQPCINLKNKQLILSCEGLINNVFICWGVFKSDGTYYGNQNYNLSITRESVVFTMPNDAVALRFYIQVESGTAINTPIVISPMLRYYEIEDSIYSPYQSSTSLQIQLGQTVYGGTLDVEKGELVVDRAMKVYDGTNYTPTDHYTGNIYVNIENTAKYKASNEDLCMSCNCAKWVANDITTRGSYCYNGSQGAYFTKNSTFASASDFATYALNNNIQMVIPLLTPITINLTPEQIKLLQGVNTITTNADNITLTYRNGSVATLSDLTSAVDNLDSKIDESKILTDTVTGDKYILVVTNGVLSVEQVSN